MRKFDGSLGNGLKCIVFIRRLLCRNKSEELSFERFCYPLLSLTFEQCDEQLTTSNWYFIAFFSRESREFHLKCVIFLLEGSVFNIIWKLFVWLLFARGKPHKWADLDGFHCSCFHFHTNSVTLFDLFIISLIVRWFKFAEHYSVQDSFTFAVKKLFLR